MTTGDDEQRPPWAGAPGYTPHPELPPHAPMPGAPPYPPHVEQPQTEIGTRPGRTGFLRSLGAALVWAAATVVLVAVVAGSRLTAYGLGEAVGGAVFGAVIAAVPTWLVARRRGWPFWGVVLVAAPFYWVLRVGVVLLSAAGS